MKVNACLENIDLDNLKCSVCKTEIIDLQSNPETFEFATDKPICVKTHLNNLNSPYYLHPIRRFVLATLLVFGGSLYTLDVTAQDTLVQIKNNVDTSYVSKNDSSYFFRILVIDKDTKEPMPFASVYYKFGEEKHGGTTDFDGLLQLNIPKIYFKEEQIELFFKSFGAITQKITFEAKDYTDIKVELNFDDSDLIIVGLWIDNHPRRVSSDPDAHRSTKFGRSDLKNTPIRNR